MPRRGEEGAAAVNPRWCKYLRGNIATNSLGSQDDTFESLWLIPNDNGQHYVFSLYPI